MYYVYIIYSASGDRYYVGSSKDPWKRLEKRNNVPFNTYTSKYRPWELAAVFQAGQTRGSAEKLDYFIKRQKSRQLIEKLIAPDFKPTGRLAQLVNVPHVRD